jgi:predicted dehydrogenase
VRIGLVGAGFMAKTHSLAYSNARMLGWNDLPSIEPVRVADVEEELARAAASRFGWGQSTTEWREVTRAPDVDLVDIVTPNNVHAEIAIDAAQHGKHVICEKPLANTVESAREMHHAVETAGVANQVGFVFRTWPAIALAKKLVDEGRIGRILRFRGQYFHDYALDSSFPMGWRVSRDVAGAGSIGDLGSHVIDLARYLVGEIDRVFALSRTFHSHRPAPSSGASQEVDVDDATVALVEFEGGAIGLIETNWMAAGYKTDLGFELSGDRGAIKFTWRRSNQLELYSDSGEEDARGFRSIHVGPMHEGAETFWPVAGQGLGYGDAFTILLGRLLRALREGTVVAPSFLDGLRASEVVDAAVRSNESRAWVEVPRGSA